MLLLKRQSRLHVALSLKDVFDVDWGTLIEKGPTVFSVNCRTLDLFGGTTRYKQCCDVTNCLIQAWSSWNSTKELCESVKTFRYLISVIVSSELCASKYLRNTLFINAGFILDARRNIILCKTQDIQKAVFCFKITSLLMNRNFWPLKFLSPFLSNINMSYIFVGTRLRICIQDPNKFICILNLSGTFRKSLILQSKRLKTLNLSLSILNSETFKAICFIV